MASELSFEMSSFSFDSLAHTGIYNCDKCNQFVPFRSLAEHFELRHKIVNNNAAIDYDDVDHANGNDDTSIMPTNRSGWTQDTLFRRRATKPIGSDMDFDTTDAESTVADIENRRGTAAAAAAAASTQLHGGRTAARGGDRYQAKRLAKFQSTRQKEQNKLNDMGATDSSATIQARRKIPTAMELFSIGRSQSEIRTQKVGGGGDGDGGGCSAGNERSNLKKFGPMRHRSVSVKRTQKVPENFALCKFCMNMMHKDYVDDHIQRKHQQCDKPSDNNTRPNGKAAIRADGSSSDADVSDTDGNMNGRQSDSGHLNGKMNVKSNGRSNGATIVNGNGKNAKSHAHGAGPKNKMIADKHEGFRRCQFCDAYIHHDYLAGHLIRKHRTEYINSSGISWLEYNDEQMNKLLKEHRIYCKNGAFYVVNA